LPIALTHAAANSIRISQQPLGTDSGELFAAGSAPQVEVLDIYGNLVLDFNTLEQPATIAARAKGDSLAIVSGGEAPFIQGVATFTDLRLTGLVETDYQLTIGAGSLVEVVTQNFRFNPGAPDRLVVATEPSAAQTRALLARNPQLMLVDARGNQIFSSSAEVKISLAPMAQSVVTGIIDTRPASAALNFCTDISDQSTCSSEIPAITMDVDRGLFVMPPALLNEQGNPVSGLQLIGSTAYRYFLDFETVGLASGGVELTAQSQPLDVANGAAANILIDRYVVASVDALAAANGAQFATQPRLRLTDLDDNPAENDSSTPVLVEISGPQGQLLGKQIVLAQNGVVTFSGLGVKGLTSGNYQLTFRAPTTQELDDDRAREGSEIAASVTPVALTPITGVSFTLNPGPIARIELDVQMTAISVSGEIAAVQPKLSAYDDLGNLATLSTTPVVATLSGGAAGVLLRDGEPVQNNSATVNFANGYAQFEDLAISGEPGELYQLSFSVGGTVPARSQQEFAVTRIPEVELEIADITFNDDAPELQLAAESFAPGELPGNVSYSVHTGSAAVCSINAATGALRILGAGSCQVTAEVAPKPIEIVIPAAGEAPARTINAGGFAGNSAIATFTVARAEQEQLEATVDGVEEVETLIGTETVISYRASVIFGQSLLLGFAGGSTEAPITFSIPNLPSEQTTQCRVVGGRLFAGNVRISQGAPGDVCEVIFERAGDGNYLPAQNKLAIRVLPAEQSPLMIASTDKMRFGETLRLFTGGGSGDGRSSLTVTSGSERCELGDSGDGWTTLRATATGSCTLSATKAASLNFLEATAAPQVVTIERVSQTLRFTSVKPSLAVVDGKYSPTVEATSGLRPVISIVDSIDPELGLPICVFEGGEVIFKLQGECKIQAEQSGNENFEAAITVIQSVLIGGLNQSIIFERPADVNFGSSPFVLQASTNSGLPLSFESGTGGDASACTVSTSGVVSVGSAGVCEVIATQLGNQTYEAASASMQRFNVLPIQSEPPFITSISVGNQAITVSYREPGDTGGSAVRAYQTILTPLDDSLDRIVDTSCLPFTGPRTGSQPTVNCQIDGLTNDVTYTLTMAAITDFGAGRLSRASEPFKPIANLVGVSSLSAMSDSSTATLNWVVPEAVEGEFMRYEIFVRLPGGEFGTEPLTSVTNRAAINATINLADLPQPIVEEEEEEENFETASVRSQNFNVANVDPDSGESVDDLPNLEVIEEVDPADEVPRYEFKVVTLSSGNPTSEDLNTTFLNQQLLTAPAAPNTLSAEEQGEDIVVGWTASKFDGGSQIASYLLFVDGECVKAEPAQGQPASSAACREFSPSQTFFSISEWSYSTTYEFEVAAQNEIGIGRTTSFSLTTGADPNPPTGIYLYPGPLLQQFSLKTAAPGQIVTITGERLNLVQRLLLGEVEAEFTLNAANQLSFRVPFEMADGMYDINVFSDFGRLTVQQTLRVMGNPVNEDLPTEQVDQPGVPEGEKLPLDLNPDIDGDGRPNGLDPDIDGDGIPNEYDPNPLVPNDPSEALEQPRAPSEPITGEAEGSDQSSASGDAGSDAGGQTPFNGSTGLPLLLIALLVGVGVAAAGGTQLLRRRKAAADSEL
jgi:hypothetical protein